MQLGLGTVYTHQRHYLYAHIFLKNIRQMNRCNIVFYYLLLQQ